MASDETKNTESTKDTTSAASAPTQPSDETQNTDAKGSPTFSDEQQRVIDEMIKGRIGRVKERADEEKGALKKQLDDTLSQLTQYREKEDAVRREIEDKEREKALQKGEYEKVIALEKQRYEAQLKKEQDERAAKEARLQQLEQDLYATKVDNALFAILTTDAVDPDAAVALLKRDYTITFDATTGKVAVNGDPDISLPSIVQEFLAKRPYLAKGQFAGKAGGGTTTTKGAPAGPTTFTKEQLHDAAFYQEHRAEIHEAMKQGKLK